MDYYSITYKDFVNCMLGDYSSMGDPDKWIDIYEQYQAELNVGNYSAYTKALYKHLQAMYRLNVFIQCMIVLKYKHSPEMVDRLKEIGLSANLNPDNPLEYMKELERLGKLSGSMSASVKATFAQVEKMKGEDDKEPNRQQYVDQLATVSKYVGFRLTDDIKLSEFVSYLKAMIEEGRKIEAGKLKNV